ncbi:hypothetical protein E4Z66_03755 [Aliishimia ponticola]|uniref:Lipoprotein n=1 Tax=Aliishimia ponticola TaxID=2499833 RepID=A0A4S4NIH8_9RHOB|nr:hypothetical protein [Aliishimia ponticola]THH38695.1 hypothetical protein E4Z66_03755 [Aliishimia ponticola]
MSRTIALLVAAGLTLAACDEATMQQVSEDAVIRRGNASCIAAVEAQTGLPGATLSDAAVILEVNQILVNAGDGGRWSCFTNEEGQAVSLIKRA